MHLCTAGGHANIPMTAPDMKSRAVEFLTRPFGDQVLLKQDRVARRQADELSALRTRRATLSRRERAKSWASSSPRCPTSTSPKGSATSEVTGRPSRPVILRHD
jgi:hypothetical protein